MTWKPVYFRHINPFGDAHHIRLDSGVLLGASTEPPARIRLAHPWELRIIVATGVAYRDDVRLGMVSTLASLLGDGWVFVVGEHDPEYLPVERPGGLSCGNSSSILAVRMVDIVPYSEDRRRVTRERVCAS